MASANVRNDIVSIVRSYGYEGEIADMLVDMLTYYVNEHLINVAGQFYNSSIFKTKNLDAALQLGLDHSVPVFRGSNTIIKLRIKTTGNITLAPLQEIFSFGSNYFYFHSSRYFQIPRNRVETINLVYSTSAKRIIEYDIGIDTNTNTDTTDIARYTNDIYVIDDNSPISDHVVFYALYSDVNNNTSINMILLPHTKYPHEFYLFSHMDASLNTYINNLYPILVLTTPRYGINIRINRKYILQNIERINNRVKLRLEYLNYTSLYPEDSILSKLIDHVNQNFPVNPEETFIVDIISNASPHDINTIKYNVAEGSRYNGVIRSVSDFRNWFVSMPDVRIYDSAMMFVYSSASSGGFNVHYILAVIADQISQNMIGSFISSHLQYIYASLPTLPISGSNINGSFTEPQTTTGPNGEIIILNGIVTNNVNVSGTNQLNSSIIVKFLEPKTINITATYVGSLDENVVTEIYSNSLKSYTMRIIEKIDPRELLSILARIQYINHIVYFKVWDTSTVYFEISGSPNNNTIRYIVLIDKNAIVTNWNTPAYYIQDFNVNIQVIV